MINKKIINKRVFFGIALLASFFCYTFSGNEYSSYIKTDKLDLGILLIKAIKSGDDRKSEYLIKAGAQINIQDNNFEGDTPLTVACSMGSIGIVKLLIKSGADINLTDKFLKTPLICACEKGKSDIVKYLLSLKTMLKLDIDAQDNRGDTAFKYAAFFGDEEIVKLLFTSGANINIPDHNGYTPLMFISYKDMRKNIFNFLVDSGAKLDEVDESGRNVLMISVSHLFKERVKILITAGVDIYLKNKYNKTPLDIAQSLADQELVDILVKADEKNKKIFDKLLECFEDFTQENNKIIRNILIKFPNLVDQNGNNALHLSLNMKNKNTEVIIFICKTKLRLINKKNHAGMSPVDIDPTIILHLINSKLINC